MNSVLDCAFLPSITILTKTNQGEYLNLMKE
jgi:hypothetical protein